MSEQEVAHHRKEIDIINCNKVSYEHHSYFVKIYKHDTYDISLNK